MFEHLGGLRSQSSWSCNRPCLPTGGSGETLLMLLGDAVFHLFPVSRGLIIRVVSILILPDIIHTLHLSCEDLHHKQHDEQEPVDVHEEEEEQQGVEEEVEGNVGNRLDAGDAGGPQHLQREPVQTKPKPGDAKANSTNVGQDVIDKVLFPASGLEVDVDFGELQLNIIDIVQK